MTRQKQAPPFRLKQYVQSQRDIRRHSMIAVEAGTDYCIEDMIWSERYQRWTIELRGVFDEFWAGDFVAADRDDKT